MNMQCSRIQEFILYEFELDHNPAEATKKICYVKGESAVNHNAVSRWSKKFYTSLKNLDNQARSGRLKTIDYKAVLQVMRQTQRVSDKFSISQSNVGIHY